MMAMGEDQSRIKVAAIGVSAPSPRTAGSGQRAAQLLLGVWRDQSWFIVLALFYLILAYIFTKFYDHPFSLFLYSKFQITIYLNLIVATCVIWIAISLYKERPARPLLFFWNDLKGDRRLQRRFILAIPPLLLLPLVVSAHTSIKLLIPVINSFAWDYEFAIWDAVFHGGTQPWELFQPILGDPLITDRIDYLYGLPWFLMVIAMKFWMTFSLDPQRVRFLVTYVLCWLLLGSVAATLFSSVGPVYYGNFVEGIDPFTSLISYLQSVDESHKLMARTIQEKLLQAHIDTELLPGAGISAMPSMHLSMGFIFVLITWRLHWLLRVVSVSYLILLQIGSVHLGWHYAIDGYVAIICTYAIWWAVGRALDWRARRRREWVDVDSTPG